VSLQAIILAGGLGTRLRSAVGDTPKVMAPVAGRPFIEHVLGQLAGAGFRHVILAVGHGREIVTAHLGPVHAGLALTYSEERAPLGTGGAVRQALQLAEAGPCFVLNGDTWLALDFAGMLKAHVDMGATLSMAVRLVPDVARFGAVRLEGGRVTGFEEKGRSGPGYINAGVYLLDREVMSGAGLPWAFSLEHDFLAKQLATLAPLAYPTHGDFIDIGVPEDYQRAQAMLARREQA